MGAGYRRDLVDWGWGRLFFSPRRETAWASAHVYKALIDRMTGEISMTAKNRVALWVFFIGAGFILLVNYGWIGQVNSDTAEILVWIGMLAMISTAYSFIFLLFTGTLKLLARSKFGHVRENLISAMSWSGNVIELAGKLALIALGLYLGYLFVSWAGFVGTLLVLIAGLLFVIVVLLIDR